MTSAYAASGTLGAASASCNNSSSMIESDRIQANVASISALAGTTTTIDSLPTHSSSTTCSQNMQGPALAIGSADHHSAIAAALTSAALTAFRGQTAAVDLHSSTATSTIFPSCSMISGAGSPYQHNHLDPASPTGLQSFAQNSLPTIATAASSSRLHPESPLLAAVAAAAAFAIAEHGGPVSSTSNPLGAAGPNEHYRAIMMPGAKIGGNHISTAATSSFTMINGLPSLPSNSSAGPANRHGVCASRHMAAEQRRRARINDRLDALRTLVPHSVRLNTAAFLSEVHDYIVSLHERLAALDEKEAATPRLQHHGSPSRPLLLDGCNEEDQHLDNDVSGSNKQLNTNAAQQENHDQSVSQDLAVEYLTDTIIATPSTCNAMVTAKNNETNGAQDMSLTLSSEATIFPSIRDGSCQEESRTGGDEAGSLPGDALGCPNTSGHCGLVVSSANTRHLRTEGNHLVDSMDGHIGGQMTSENNVMKRVMIEIVDGSTNVLPLAATSPKANVADECKNDLPPNNTSIVRTIPAWDPSTSHQGQGISEKLADLEASSTLLTLNGTERKGPGISFVADEDACKPNEDGCLGAMTIKQIGRYASGSLDRSQGQGCCVVARDVEWKEKREEVEQVAWGKAEGKLEDVVEAGKELGVEVNSGEEEKGDIAGAGYGEHLAERKNNRHASVSCSTDDCMAEGDCIEEPESEHISLEAAHKAAEASGNDVGGISPVLDFNSNDVITPPAPSQYVASTQLSLGLAQPNFASQRRGDSIPAVTEGLRTVPWDIRKVDHETTDCTLQLFSEGLGQKPIVMAGRIMNINEDRTLSSATSSDVGACPPPCSSCAINNDKIEAKGEEGASHECRLTLQTPNHLPQFSDIQPLESRSAFSSVLVPSIFPPRSFTLGAKSSSDFSPCPFPQTTTTGGNPHVLRPSPRAYATVAACVPTTSAELISTTTATQPPAALIPEITRMQSPRNLQPSCKPSTVNANMAEVRRAGDHHTGMELDLPMYMTSVHEMRTHPSDQAREGCTNGVPLGSGQNPGSSNGEDTRCSHSRPIISSTWSSPFSVYTSSLRDSKGGKNPAEDSGLQDDTRQGNARMVEDCNLGMVSAEETCGNHQQIRRQQHCQHGEQAQQLELMKQQQMQFQRSRSHLNELQQQPQEQEVQRLQQHLSRQQDQQQQQQQEEQHSCQQLLLQHHQHLQQQQQHEEQHQGSLSPSFTSTLTPRSQPLHYSPSQAHSSASSAQSGPQHQSPASRHQNASQLERLSPVMPLLANSCSLPSNTPQNTVASHSHEDRGLTTSTTTSSTGSEEHRLEAAESIMIMLDGSTGGPHSASGTRASGRSSLPVMPITCVTGTTASTTATTTSTSTTPPLTKSAAIAMGGPHDAMREAAKEARVAGKGSRGVTGNPQVEGKTGEVILDASSKNVRGFRVDGSGKERIAAAQGGATIAGVGITTTSSLRGGNRRGQGRPSRQPAPSPRSALNPREIHPAPPPGTQPISRSLLPPFPTSGGLPLSLPFLSPLSQIHPSSITGPVADAATVAQQWGMAAVMAQAQAQVAAHVHAHAHALVAAAAQAQSAAAVAAAAPSSSSYTPLPSRRRKRGRSVAEAAAVPNACKRVSFPLYAS